MCQLLLSYVHIWQANYYITETPCDVDILLHETVLREDVFLEEVLSLHLLNLGSCSSTIRSLPPQLKCAVSVITKTLKLFVPS